MEEGDFWRCPWNITALDDRRAGKNRWKFGQSRLCMVSEQKVSAPHEGRCLLAGIGRGSWYWKSPITHLGEGPSSTNTVQVVDKNEPVKAARPMGSNHAAAQGGSSCRAREAWGVPGTPIPPHGLQPEQRHNGTTSACSQQTAAVSKAKPNPTFPATGSCLTPTMALYWLFFHDPVPFTKPAENPPRKKPHNVSAGSDWAHQRPGECQHGHTEGLLSTKWGAGRTEQETTCFDSSILRTVQPSHGVTFLCSIAWRFTLPVPACVNSAPCPCRQRMVELRQRFFFFFL